jgi:hypothetical protein
VRPTVSEATTPANNLVPQNPSSSSSTPCQSAQSTLGTHPSTRFIDETFLSPICDASQPQHDLTLAYLASLETDLDSGEENCRDPRAYAAKHRVNDPDAPSYNDALTGQHATEYEQAMVKEISQLIKQRTWSSVP